MKKYYKFLFLLLFGFFVFIPKDTFADSIILYTADYEIVKQCSSCRVLTLTTDSSLGARNVSRIRFYDTNLSLTKNHKYTFNTEIALRLYGGYNTIPKLKNCSMYVGGYNISDSAEKSSLSATNTVNSPAFSWDYSVTRTFSSAHTENYLECETNTKDEIITSVYFEPSIIDLGDQSTDDIKDSLQGQTDSIITNQNSNTDKVIENQNQLHEEDQETKKGIWETIKSLPSMFLDMLLGLFIPDDFSFIDNLKESLENKLGFIAEIPISVLDFTLNLATAGWDSFDSINLPSIEVFGVSFWNSQEISLQPAIDIFEPYKYITDFLCVILCVNTLLKWYHSFSNGGGN